MKQLVLLLLSVVMPFMVFAQDGLVAALYHGDDFKIYYSADAFKNAMADAVNGDIITLSPGTFTATTINKAVTIRGAGIGAVDSINNAGNLPTIIDNSSNRYSINVPVDSISGHTLNIEGIIYNGSFQIVSLSNAVISKTRFYGGLSRNSSSTTINNVTFIQCIFDGSFTLDSDNTISIYNSVLLSGLDASAHINNCFILINSSYTRFDSRLFTYNNCIFFSEYKSAYLSSSQAFNCVWVGLHNSSGAFYGQNSYPERNNKTVPEGVEIFVPGSFYELNENGKKYLGGDGTEVGIYGSRLPFSTDTSYPQIKKFSVAPESTDDGKLKIEFEIQ